MCCTHTRSPFLFCSQQVTEPLVDQSHLTQVQIGFDTQTPMSTMFQSEEQQTEENEEDILAQVDVAAEILKETMIDHVPAEVRYASGLGVKNKTSLSLYYVILFSHIMTTVLAFSTIYFIVYVFTVTGTIVQ